MDSILTAIKKLLGIEEDYTHFDADIILNINSVLMVLNQLGIGPETGLYITDKDETWSSLLGERKDLEAVKTYVYLKVRMMFDPPTNSFLVDATERQLTEFEWRLRAQAEKTEIIEEGGIADGG